VSDRIEIPIPPDHPAVHRMRVHLMGNGRICIQIQNSKQRLGIAAFGRSKRGQWIILEPEKEQSSNT
jgi:hypothetical protein